MSTTIERRAFAGLELRGADSKNPVLFGYAALFNSRSLDLGGFVEVIKPGAFKRSLAAAGDIVALAHHDTSRPLARRSAGTLTLTEDDKGLLVEIQLGNTTAARDVAADVASRNIEGMSFGFATRADKWTLGASSEPDLRELLDVELYEVSPVTMPAYPDTSIAKRSQPARSPLTDVPAAIRLQSALLRLIALRS